MRYKYYAILVYKPYDEKIKVNEAESITSLLRIVKELIEEIKSFNDPANFNITILLETE